VRDAGATGVTADSPAGAQRGRARSDLGPGTALRFVVLLGFLSLFADMTYEGARSVTGPFMVMLGASAAIVGTVSGLGELAGYGLRLLSGFVTDRSRRYWTAVIIGYGINLFSVPLLALAGHWQVAAFLIVLERTGRAIRKPAGDAMLAHAASSMGRGWGFGLREAMDQTGAVIGPLIVALVLARHAGYHRAFALLGIPATIALAVLLLAQRLYPRPQDLEVRRPSGPAPRHFSSLFWIYVAAGVGIALGTVDFPLAAYHFARTAIVPPVEVPLLYALAMVASAVSAPLVGRLYDRLGLGVVAGAALVPALASPLLFLGDARLAAVGVALWGVGMGVQDATVRSAIGDIVHADHRARAYGIFDAAFGIAWFAGSALMGVLYGRAPIALVAFSVTAQLVAVGFLSFASISERPSRR
jgi:MFS family permease